MPARLLVLGYPAVTMLNVEELRRVAPGSSGKLELWSLEGGRDCPAAQARPQWMRFRRHSLPEIPGRAFFCAGTPPGGTVCCSFPVLLDDRMERRLGPKLCSLCHSPIRNFMEKLGANWLLWVNAGTKVGGPQGRPDGILLQPAEERGVRHH
jgi:hypothetical protein